ncbi:hypothetical protein [Rhodococcus sp. HS-D2]|uniref:hypothetical protein n=1 Tax=Rhodococcus sp. HS-D2 TaxID=1384636 RepID=UPI0007D9849A|nr:hypothetical protein [Rhodococcus sp. HS-D2]
MTTPYSRGHEAGYTEAVEREHIGDATSAVDGPTWFTAPATEDDAVEYEHGWLAGWSDYFQGRRP